MGAGLGFTAVAYNVDAPILALILSGVAFAVVRFFGRIAVFGLALASVLYLGAAPVIGLLAGSVLSPDQSVLAIAKQSWSARVAIWRFVATKICEAPLFGWGLDASRSWPESIPMHPHNAALQIWLELGALGVILTALFWVWLFTKVADIATSDKTMAAAAAASAVAYLTIGALSFGVWQEWWLAVGALVIVFCGFVAATRRRDFSEGFAPNTLRPV